VRRTSCYIPDPGSVKLSTLWTARGQLLWLILAPAEDAIRGTLDQHIHAPRITLLRRVEGVGAACILNLASLLSQE
jgi:hypothetical protein